MLGPSVARRLDGLSIPLSGFRLRNRINSRGAWDEFLVFQGASYFRAVSRGTLYGLSARGLALKTAHPTGEEFPAFTHFWIERPSANAAGIVVHALLESASTTGAYRFSIVPGTETIMDVKLTGSMSLALRKRPVTTEALEAAVDRIEAKLLSLGENEVPSEKIGELVMKELKKLDKVAYIRFASVYRNFADVDEFSELVREVQTRPKRGRPATPPATDSEHDLFGG